MSKATPFVALLRGINLGRKRVAMPELKRVVESLGYGSVRTLLNTGNVVFTSDKGGADRHGAKLERAIADLLGVSCRVIVLGAADLTEIVEANPLAEIADNPSRLQVAVLAAPADRERVAPLTRQRWEPEAIALGRRSAYLWCPNGYAKSLLAEAFAKAARDRVTVRTWGTISKLHGLMAG
ncbi:MAG: DUF1697 domain-containing protein [Gemmatimonadales bacterium]